MTTYIKPSQGMTIGYDQEATLGAGGTVYEEFRPEEIPDWPTATKKLIANPNVGHAHPASKADKPVGIGNTGEGSLNLRVRRATAADTAPMIANFFESMGCDVKTTTKTTVVTYASTTSWTIGDGVQYGIVGDIIMPKLEAAGNALDEWYYPCLIAAKNESNETVTPAMALPAASTAAEPVEVVTSWWPKSQVQQSGKSLAFNIHTRGDSVGDNTEYLGFLYKGCAVGSVGEIVLTPNEPIKIPFNLLFGNITRQSEAIATESFTHNSTFAVVTDQFRVEFADAATAGGIARSDAIFREAKIDLGITAVPIVGEGEGTVNGRSGYVLTFGKPKVTLTMTYLGEAVHTDFWTELEAGNSTTSKYLGLVQPTSSLATPAWAFYMPSCYIDPDSPPKLKRDREVLDVEVTLIGDCAGYTSTTASGLAADEGYAPWYMGISGAGA